MNEAAAAYRCPGGQTGQADLAAVGADTGLSVSGTTAATSSLAALDSAISQVSSLRSQFGSAQTRLEGAVRLLGVQIEGTTRAQSAIRDADVAVEVANLTRASIVQEASIAAMGQANQNLSLLLRLL